MSVVQKNWTMIFKNGFQQPIFSIDFVDFNIFGQVCDLILGIIALFLPVIGASKEWF